MKRCMKINILGLLMIGLISSNSFGMRGDAKTRLANINPAVANSLRNSAQRLKTVDTNKVKLGALITGNALVAGYGLHQMLQHNNPAFTVENINKYDETHMEYFTQQTLQNITLSDAKTIEACRGVLKKHPDIIVDTVIKDPKNLSIEQLDALFNRLEEQCYYGDVNLARLKDAARKAYGTPDINYIIEFGCRNNPLKKQLNSPRCTLPESHEQSKLILSLSQQEFSKLSIDNLNYLYTHYNEHPWLAHSNIASLLQWASQTYSRQDFLFGSSNPLMRISSWIGRLYSYKNTSKLEFSDLITLSELQNINYNPSWGYRSETVNEYLKKNSESPSFQYPFFMYENTSQNPNFLPMVIENMDTLSVDQINLLYDKVFTNPKDRQKIKDTALAIFEKQIPLVSYHTLDTIPHFLLEPVANAQTISEHHYNANLDTIAHSEIIANKAYKSPFVRKIFAQLYTHQKEEQKKGNYLFYHGRSSSWEFIADIFKQTHNAVNPDKKVGDDYVFLRFDSEGKSKYTYASKGEDALWMNAALYGNASNFGCSPAKFVYDNSDWSETNFSIETVFSQLGLEKYSTAYNGELKKLKELHTAANSQKFGNLLAVSIPEKELHRIRVPQLWFGNPSRTKAMIKNKQINDNYEFVLPLTKDYALDPEKGPRIYSYHAYDPNKYKEYEEYRDQLFAQIANRIQADKANVQNNTFKTKKLA